MTRIYIDKSCEVYDLLLPVAAGDFEDFDTVALAPNSVYIVGRNTMIKSALRIRNAVESKLTNIVFSIPTEGSTTVQGQFSRFSTRDLIESGQIIVLSGSPLDSRYRHFYFENFLQRIMNFDENLSCVERTDEIYNKVCKPFKFLMLNGRMRPHRKWMIQSLRDRGLLQQGLYTNLHAQNVPVSDLTYIKDGSDLMHCVEPIQYLPAQYEVDFYQDRVGVPCENTDVKHHLFKNEWGEIYIKAEPYIDTYFSIVTETTYQGSNSFRTEKIWKPILIGHPWICVANAGFYRDIRNLGFRTFDKVVDESFDDVTDSRLRFEKITAIIQDLCNGSLEDFLSECKSICKYNQQHMFNFQKHVNNFPYQFVNFLRETTSE